MAEILEIAKPGTLKTQIMYRANLSYAQLCEYLRFMLKTSLLNKFNANGKEVYGSTKKGEDFLHRHFELNELLKDPENSNNRAKSPPAYLLKNNQNR